MKHNFEEEDQEYYSPTSWSRHADETSEDYQDREEDQNNSMEFED